MPLLFAVTANLADAEDVVQERLRVPASAGGGCTPMTAVPPRDGLVTERHGGQGCGE